MHEVGEGLVGPSQFRSSKGKPQQLTVNGLDLSALLLAVPHPPWYVPFGQPSVDPFRSRRKGDCEFQLARQVPRNTGLDAFTGARALRSANRKV
jgi:hypothetical protein